MKAPSLVFQNIPTLIFALLIAASTAQAGDPAPGIFVHAIASVTNFGLYESSPFFPAMKRRGCWNPTARWWVNLLVGYSVPGDAVAGEFGESVLVFRQRRGADWYQVFLECDHGRWRGLLNR